MFFRFVLLPKKGFTKSAVFAKIILKLVWLQKGINVENYAQCIYSSLQVCQCALYIFLVFLLKCALKI